MTNPPVRSPGLTVSLRLNSTRHGTVTFLGGDCTNRESVRSVAQAAVKALASHLGAGLIRGEHYTATVCLHEEPGTTMGWYVRYRLEGKEMPFEDQSAAHREAMRVVYETVLTFPEFAPDYMHLFLQG